jgi:hypothetical protein
MANAYKTLGNGAPGANLTTIYTCPSGTQAVAKLVVANRSAAAKQFRVAVSPLGAAISDSHYWFYDTYIPANDTIELDGISKAATDVIRIYGEDSTVSFNLNGVEIT